MIKQGINNLYPTPLYKTSISEELCDKILNLLLENGSLHKFTNGNDNLFNSDELVIKEFKQEVHAIFSQYFDQALNKNLNDYSISYKGWINGNPNQGLTTHNHSGAPFVSVFYIFARCDDEGGELVLNDPRSNANRGYMQDFQEPFNSLHYKPKTGDVVVFPGYVYHSVNPFSSGQLRVAIPVDLIIYNKDDSDDC